MVLWLSALAMQTLGLLHGYEHPHASPLWRALATQAQEVESDAVAAVPSASTPVHWLKALFAGHHDGSAGCTLFDQLTHADVLHDLPALPLGAAVHTSVDEVHVAWHLAAQATGFLARAPPLRA